MRPALLLAPILMMAGPAAADVTERQVELPDKLGSGYLYQPAERSGDTAAVIVVHEWWGLNDFAKGRAKQLAEAGYTALAVDMYGHGEVATTPDEAKALAQEAMENLDGLNARFDAAMKLLRETPGVDANRLFAIGFCFGGGIVLRQARRGVDLAGVASFHGNLVGGAPAKKGVIKARVLAATGADDATVPVEQVQEFVKDMTQAGAEFELLSFPGVKHGFTNPAATEKAKKYGLPLAYDAHADRVSWDALMGFLGAP